MYEFPPPIWTNQHWTIVRLAAIAVFGLILPLIVARLTKPNSFRTTTWVIVGTISLCAFGNYFLYGAVTFEPYRYMMVLPGLLVIISSYSLFRMWWQSTHGKARIHEGIVIALILMVLITITLPGSTTPTDVSRRTQCRNNLKQIGLAMHNYHDVHGSFPAAALGQPPVSWRIALLPYLEHASLAEQYNRNLPWNSSANALLQNTKVPPYACPSRPSQFDSHWRFLTAYIVPNSDGAIFSSNTGTPYSEIKDGTSNTFLAMEACGTEIVWTEPRDVDSSNAAFSVNAPGPVKGMSGSMTSSWYFAGSQVCLADGSVRFIDTRIDPRVMQALITKDGGEEIEEW